MENVIRVISRVFRGAIRAFERYPVVIANAAAFSIVTIIRIHLDWQQQEAYNFIFNCLHLSFALGAIFSLAAITAAQSRLNTKKSFVIANVLGISATVLTIILLYFFSGVYPEYSAMRYQNVSTLAAARVSAIIFVSFILFNILAGYPREQSDFSKAFFMIHKSFFIALLYGLVIMAGASGVAGAIQALLYKGLSSKVYGYIGTISGFLAFTIFIGYFPDFRKGIVDEQREISQNQPRFIEVLFEYIMVPIMLALTLVLILWVGKTIMEGMRVPFVQLSSIASSYAIGGIWLHIMVTHYKTGLAMFYKKVHSIAVILILAVEAWALAIQLQKHGLKTTEYFFILIWIVALSAAILLMIKKERAHNTIAIIVGILAIITVAPYIGYNSLPVTAQVNRLEGILEKEGMFKDHKIIPATKGPEQNVRESITDSVLYLTSLEDVKLPTWLNKDFRNNDIFKKNLGFEQTFPKHEDGATNDYMGTFLYLTRGAVNIKDYSWAINMQDSYGKEDYVVINGEKGTYKIYWKANQPGGIPYLEILLNDETIVDMDMNKYIDKVSEKYPPGKMNRSSVPIEDMSMKFETPELRGLLIFNSVDISLDPRLDKISYWINPGTLYIDEKL
ncbi:MAG: hypothetical protein ACOX0L_00645 [Natronincolaceae bacterium]|jgi:hypothetical protein|nr:DUF4153 domain-containing protein [Bacillota bacterium]NLK90611.1 DUF4153 domain-containing protein [Clostridiales bacterium]